RVGGGGGLAPSPPTRGRGMRRARVPPREEREPGAVPPLRPAALPGRPTEAGPPPARGVLVSTGTMPGTGTHAVRTILGASLAAPWRTMQQVASAGSHLELSLGAVASALADLEAAGLVEVRRTGRPYRYRGRP